eukprot:TRINITY_DN8022_c0_g2_i2.p1 TRINITY_DN8022_c0_g2~~TRINITY_DN8022_c0_g2_i2.p1  ORF type:complete len:818 (-),score=241.63 TRINITY_DN8022_c0_g2_i2:37-2490(-)
MALACQPAISEHMVQVPRAAPAAVGHSDEEPPLVSDRLRWELERCGLPARETQELLARMGLRTLSALGSGNVVVEEACAAISAASSPAAAEQLRQLIWDSAIDRRPAALGACAALRGGGSFSVDAEGIEGKVNHLRAEIDDAETNADSLSISMAAESEGDELRDILKDRLDELERTYSGASQIRILVKNDKLEAVAEAVVKANETQGRRIAPTMQDILACLVCLRVGVHDEQAYEQELQLAFRGQLPSEMRAKMLQAFHQSLGSLPGAFTSKTKTAGKTRKRQRRPPQRRKAQDVLLLQWCSTFGATGASERDANEFWPQALDEVCFNTWRIEANAYHAAIVEPTSSAEECVSCIGSLCARLSKVHWWRVRDYRPDLGRRLTEDFARLAVATMLRFADEASVQQDCIASLLEFCKARQICGGLFCSTDDGDTPCPAFSYETYVEIRSAVMKALENGSEEFREKERMFDEGHNLLARSQPFLSICTNMYTLHMFMTEMFNGLEDHLYNCYSSEEDTKERDFSKLVLQALTQQRLSEDAAAAEECVPNILSWVQNKYWASCKDQRLAIFLAGLLLPFKKEVLLPLASHEDHQVVDAGYTAVACLWHFVDGDGKKEILQWLFDEGPYHHDSSHSRAGDQKHHVQVARLTAIALVLRGQAAASPGNFAEEEPEGDAAERAVVAYYASRAVAVAIDVAWKLLPWQADWKSHDSWCQQLWRDLEYGGGVNASTLLTVALWTLNELFEGSNHLGDHEDEVIGLAEHVCNLFREDWKFGHCYHGTKDNTRQQDLMENASQLVLMRKKQPRRQWSLGAITNRWMRE